MGKECEDFIVNALPVCLEHAKTRSHALAIAFGLVHYLNEDGEEQENGQYSRQYFFGGTPVGTATMAATHEDNSSFSTESNQNIEAAREYSADRNNLPYILFGGAGLILFLLLLWRIIKVAKS